jgi:hypothetical protein
MTEIFETEPEYGNSAGRVNLTGYNGSKWREVRLDSSTRALNCIDNAHHEIHDGSAFVVNTVVDLAGNSSQTNIFVSGLSNKESNMIWRFISEAEADFKLYEDVTVSSSGTPVTIWNRNRASLTTSNSLVFSSAEISDTGTNLIVHHHWGSGKDGGELREISEWVLKSGTVYSTVLTNEVATANQVTFILDWYDHTPKDA